MSNFLKPYLTLLGLLFLFLPVLQAQDSLSVSIDGDLTDWPRELPAPLSEEYAQYALHRAEGGLYLLLTSADDHWHKHMLMTGLTLRIRPEGSKKYLRQIGYPLGLASDIRPNDPNELNRFLGALRRKRDTLLASMDYFTYIGPSVINPKGQDTLWSELPSPIGVQVASRFDAEKDLWIAEWFLPYALWPGDTDWTRPIALEWRTGKLGRPIQLRGNDAAGMQEGAIYTPKGGNVERTWYDRLDLYRTFSAVIKLKAKAK